MRHSALRIGLDLDNTIIDYDRAFLTAARERGLIGAGFTGTKQQVRDHIRTLPDGELTWQKLQGHVYGQGIEHAALYPGVREFAQAALSAGHELFIASHKTEFGHYDESRTNLREAALCFLESQGWFDLGFSRNHISFHATRQEKVQRITHLALDWFIDDLIEVFEEETFPATTQKILFHTANQPAATGHWQVCGGWVEILSTLTP